ncbi:MAG: PIN domain-containing protein, partial [Methylococcaceae bacterium]
MKISVLLDTSFLISLNNETRPNHETAHKYYKYMLEQNITMYLSSIVVAEFSIKEKITDLPLRNFRILPFNFPDGIEAGEIFKSLGGVKSDDSRAVARDDLKIIAQGLRENIPFVLTEDVSTFYRDCERLTAFGKNIKAIVLKHGFDSSQLRLDGQ